MAIFLAVFSSVMWGISSFIGGFATKKLGALFITLLSSVVNLVVVLAVVLMSHQHLVWTDLIWGFAAGVGALVGLLSLLKGLAEGQMGIVAPLAASIASILPFLVGVIRGDRIRLIDAVGVLFVLTAVYLLTRTSSAEKDIVGKQVDKATERNAVRVAVVAGIAFGFVITVLSFTSGESGSWPLVAQRSTIVILLCSFLVFSRQLMIATTANFSAMSFSVMGFAVICGASQALGDVAYMKALYGGPLAIVAVVGGLYPVSTVLLARLVLNERLDIGRVIGFVLALMGIAAFALG